MCLYKFMGNSPHINHQKTKFFTLCFIITVFLVNQSAAQQLQLGSIKRSVHLPVEITNGIPYLNLKNLCEVEVKQQMIGDQKDWPIPKQSQFQQMSNFYELSDVVVLLDTGSSEFWLADNSCYKCSHTKNFCPHLQTSEKKNNYVKGYIQGIDSYINMCSNRIKFMCVRKMEGLGQINGHGILGLTHQATGFTMLFSILRKRPSNKIRLQQTKNKQGSNKRGSLVYKYMRQTFQLKLIYGQYKSYFYISQTLAIEKYNSKHQGMATKKEKMGFEVKCQKDWSFDVQQISFFEQAIKIKVSPQKIKKMRVNVDTGSSKLVLSNNLCGILIGEAQERVGLRCRYVQDKGIDCNKVVTNFNFAVKVKEDIVISDEASKDKSILKIQDSFLIDPASNRLQILCQQSQQSLGLILLGHSFLQSSHTTFKVQTFKQMSSQEETVELTQYSIRTEPRQIEEKGEDRILKLMIIFYMLTVGLMAWGTIATLDFLRDKRSTKIII